MNVKLLAVAAAVTGLAGCASPVGTGPAAGSGSSAPPVPAASSSAPPCLTRACIAADIGRSLIGAVAKDEAVITKADCKASTVTRNAGDTYTAKCTVTYSDGSTATGFGNLLVAQQKVTFEPDLSGF